MAGCSTAAPPQAVTEISPATGSNLFGKYELGKLLGCGAFAKVYHARNVITGQSVAIKSVSKQKVLKGGLTAHVRREISIMRRLRHPHIIKLFEVLATKTKIYFVMEFAKGGELFKKVAKGRFSEDLSRRYFQQLITAVGYCHARGVFHRDLKPENLLLDEHWNLKVTDFGLSAVRDQIRQDGLLHTLCGTPAYVAPEILAKKGYDGAKVDVWSCGIILYVLNAGYLPFNDTNLMAMYRKIYKGEYRCPKWTPPDLKRLLSRLLDTNPDTRITIDEIIEYPWFKQDYKEIKFHMEDFDLKENNLREEEEEFLNAFDIIAYSSGFDLSSLFNDADTSVCGEQFLAADSPDNIIDRVEEIAKAEGLCVAKRTRSGAKFEGRNGNFVMVVEIYRLTEELVVIEVKEKEVNARAGEEIWKDKIRPKLITALIYRPQPEEEEKEGQSVGNCQRGWTKYGPDSIVGRNKKSEAFWGKIADYCNEHCSFHPPRDGMSCRNHYNYINQKLSKWIGAYDNAKRIQQSGWSENDVLAKAHELYSSGSKDSFNLMSEWYAVRDQPRYRVYGTN